MSKFIPEITGTGSLPDWISPKLVENLSILVLVFLGIALLFVLRFISKLLLKLTFLIVIAALAFGVWSERSQLSGCVNTCNCEILGQNIQIPYSKNPFCQES